MWITISFIDLEDSRQVTFLEGIYPVRNLTLNRTVPFVYNDYLISYVYIYASIYVYV